MLDELDNNMKIGIDISQIAYEGTGVARLLYSLITAMLEKDKENEYILFFSSLRLDIKDQISKIKNINPNVKLKTFKFPLSLLDLLWNKLHIAPIEWFIGDIDVFITSDWTEPPTKRAKKGTILYDLIVYKYPEGTDKKIIQTQKQKLKWVKKESEFIFCISEATKKDAIELLDLEKHKLHVIHPGV